MTSLLPRCDSHFPVYQLSVISHHQAMLYGAGVPNPEAMAKSPHVGIGSVWWEGNPCNMHLLDLGKTVKKAVQEQEMIAWQYNTIGVSDGITVGHEGKLI